jgi:serine/threonine-protein kinase
MGLVYRALNLAQIYTMLGEKGAAIDELEHLLSIPSPLSVPLLRLDPIWDPLRDHPRFHLLVGGEN